MLRYTIIAAVAAGMGLMALGGCHKKDAGPKPNEVTEQKPLTDADPAPQPKPDNHAPGVLPPAPLAHTYTIQKGDTLWAIAQKQLGAGKRVPAIVALNPGLNPAKLKPGQVIKLPET